MKNHSGILTIILFEEQYPTTHSRDPPQLHLFAITPFGKLGKDQESPAHTASLQAASFAKYLGIGYGDLYFKVLQETN